MHLDEWSLRDPAGRAARVAALELITRARTTRERLSDPDDVEALHDFRVSLRRLRSWLRAFDAVLDDTLPAKAPRRLKRLADATGASRDLEVHLAWVAERRRTLRGGLRRGADWLIEHLGDRKKAHDAELHEIVDAQFDRAIAAVHDAMMYYSANVVDPDTRFATLAARLVRKQASVLTKALRLVTGPGDRAEAHDARIAAKRLRYLLDPLDRAIPNVKSVVDELGDLQDRLGELHDAQLFGSEIATAVADQLADRANNVRQRADTTALHEHHDPVPGLLAFARRLRRAEEMAFIAVKSTWLDEKTAPLLARVSSIALALDRIGREGRDMRRVYLLRSMPNLPADAGTTEIDTGTIPGELLREQVRREQGTDGTTFYRSAVVGGPKAAAIEETISERVFTALWPLTKGDRSRARRHHVTANDQTWDVYELVDREVVLAATHTDDSDAAPSMPDWLEAVLDRDVTTEESYRI